MAYLNVIPPPSIPIPSLRGLGGPVLVRPRGMGQVATTCAQYLAQQLAALPPASTAAMLLNTPTPSGAVLSSLYINGATSADQAAQVVYQLAQEFCGQQADNVTFGGTLPGDCSDAGTAAANAAYPAWLAYYQALPASVWTTGTVSAQVANPQLFFAPAQPPLGQQSITTLPDGTIEVQTGGSPADIPTSAVIVNSSRGGTSFVVGDSFNLTIKGSPNSPVNETASSQNGASQGGFAAGSTDSTGTLVITGTFDSSTIGSWQETWQVGNGTRASISFSVAASGGQQQGGGGGQQSGGGSSGGSTQTTTFQLPSFLTNDISLGGFNVPVWGLIAAGVAVVLFAPRGR